MNDESCSETVEIDCDNLAEAISCANDNTIDWIEGGEWGTEGASITGYWYLYCDGDKLANGSITVDIEPDHETLILKAGGNPDCDHDWTSEGEGGCTENPGVWSVGGTAMVFGICLSLPQMWFA